MTEVVDPAGRVRRVVRGEISDVNVREGGVSMESGVNDDPPEDTRSTPPDGRVGCRDIYRG